MNTNKDTLTPSTPSLNPSPNDTTEKDKNKVEIVIVRHKQLFDMLKDAHTMWRVLVSLFFVVVVLFVGLSCVVLTVKSFYPYNTINTNKYGATIMKSEDKDVSYWLFNTAELWANSGIEVHKNDILTIRASGASNTALHYLVDASKENHSSRYGWVGTEGLERDYERSVFRQKRRIMRNLPYGLLLMQIIPQEKAKQSSDWYNSDMAEPYLNKNSHIMMIGRERQDILVQEDGILHFAVNDIVMTDENLDFFIEKNIEELFKLLDEEKLKGSLTDSLETYLQAQKEEAIRLINQICTEDDNEAALKSLCRLNARLFNPNTLNPKEVIPKELYKADIDLKSLPQKTIDDYIKAKGYSFGYYYKDNDNKGNKIHKEGYPLVNELIYYKQHKFRDPWYADNVGSFLIVIERKQPVQ